MPKRLGLSLVLLLCLVATAPAQLPVIDAGNLVQNTTTAIESVLTTIETVLMEANQVLELTPLDAESFPYSCRALAWTPA